MKNHEIVSDMGVMWLSRADKIVDKDTIFRKEYDYIHTVLSGNIRYDE